MKVVSDAQKFIEKVEEVLSKINEKI